MRFRITINVLDDEDQIIDTPESRETLRKMSTSPAWDAWIDSIIEESRDSAKNDENSSHN